MQNFFNSFNKISYDPKKYSNLALAYIGDSVFNMCAKNYIIKKGNIPVKNLHKDTNDIINAKTQAKMYNYIEQFLSDEELSIMKRGRNAKNNNCAKNSNISEYRKATGLETLFGYLFLKGKNERLFNIFEICLKICE